MTLATRVVFSESESLSVINEGASQAEVFCDFIGTSICQAANARDRRRIGPPVLFLRLLAILCPFMRPVQRFWTERSPSR